MVRHRIFAALLVITISVLGISADASCEKLKAFVGSVSKAPMDELKELYLKETGVTIEIIYGGSGWLLSQLILGRRGDLYIPASPDFMEKAVAKGVALDETSVKLAYINPAILVRTGNPKKIRGLQSLAKKGLKVVIPNPRTVSSGVYAVEVLEVNSLAREVKPNIVTYSESYEKALNLITLKIVDAIIGWQQIPPWAEEKIKVIPLSEDQIPRVAYISAAATRFVRHVDQTKHFLDILRSERVGAIFRKHGFPVSEEEIKRLAPKAVIGGEYKLPEGW